MNSEIDDVGSGQIYIYCSNDAMTEEEYITPDDLEALREIEGVEESLSAVLLPERQLQEKVNLH